MGLLWELKVIPGASIVERGVRHIAQSNVHNWMKSLYLTLRSWISPVVWLVNTKLISHWPREFVISKCLLIVFLFYVVVIFSNLCLLLWHLLQANCNITIIVIQNHCWRTFFLWTCLYTTSFINNISKFNRLHIDQKTNVTSLR